MKNFQNKIDKNLVIYMATHNEKCNHILRDDFIIPIQVGKALNDSCIEEVTDNTGNNISDKNKIYCELTALYWIWKNTNEEYVGLYHYRRQFNISKKEILKILEDADIIMPKRKLFRMSIKEQYIREHGENEWNILMDILKEMYPEYYKFSNKVFERNKIYRFNMFITKKALFNKYCEWIFPLLEKIEKRVGVEDKNEYQKRYIGFMAERLFTLYVIYNKFEIYEADLIFSGKRVNENIKNMINRVIFNCKLLRE